MSDDFKYGMKITFRRGELQHSDALAVLNARGFSDQDTLSPFLTLLDEDDKVVLILNSKTVLWIAPLTENELA